MTWIISTRPLENLLPLFLLHQAHLCGIQLHLLVLQPLASSLGLSLALPIPAHVFSALGAVSRAPLQIASWVSPTSSDSDSLSIDLRDLFTIWEQDGAYLQSAQHCSVGRDKYQVIRIADLILKCAVLVKLECRPVLVHKCSPERTVGTHELEIQRSCEELRHTKSL